MKITLRRYRHVRKLAIALAALPVFQLSACQTAAGFTGMSVVNSIPSTWFNIMLNTALSPIYSFLAGSSNLSGLGFLGGRGGLGGGI